MGQKRLGELVQLVVKRLGLPTVGQALRLFPVADVEKGIVLEVKGDLVFAELSGQPVVPVAVELQAAGQPGGHVHKPSSSSMK